MRIFAVMPAYHEAGRVKKTIDAVLPYVENIVVVDDGSQDTTAQETRQTSAILVRHVINRGQGAALRTGTKAALALGADIIVHIDADGQHDPSFIPSLIEKIRNDQADVILGSRFLGIEAQGIPAARRLLLKAARAFNKYVLGIPHHVTDPQCGLRALNRKAAESLRFSQDGMAHASELLRLITRSSLRWQEIPIRVIYSEEVLAKGQKPSNAFRIVWSLFWGAFRD